MASSIYDPSLRNELRKFTFDLLKEISLTSNMSYDDLLTHVRFDKDPDVRCSHVEITRTQRDGKRMIIKKKCKRQCVPGMNTCCLHCHKEDVELEFIIVDGNEYLYEPETCLVYSYSAKPTLLGKMTPNLEISLF